MGISEYPAPWGRALGHVREIVTAGPPLNPDLQVRLHFHPDRLVGEALLLKHLVADGIYRSQFETGTSNGGLTAHAGADRWWWERHMFGGAYDRASPSDRPKYGSLGYRRHGAGGSVRFGSSHLILSAKALERTTFCYPDSNTSPSNFGTRDQMPLIELAENDQLDVLDDRIEAQVHGPLELDQDIQAVVLDPSDRGTDVEDAAAELPFETLWHHGFRLHLDVLDDHSDYRGQDVVNLGHDIAQDGWLNPRIIGDAARTNQYPPQTVKQVWHCVARFGHDWDLNGPEAPRPGR